MKINHKNDKAGGTARAAGAGSVANVARTCQVPQRTLERWHKSRPVVFLALCQFTARQEGEA